MAAPRLTVCIPAYNQPDLLRETLTSLCDQGFERDDFIVAVSDDASPLPLEDVVVEFRDRLQIMLRPQRAECRAPAELGALLATDRHALPVVSFT